MNEAVFEAALHGHLLILRHKPLALTAATRLGVTSALRGHAPGARWASGSELRSLHGAARAGRLALGRCRGRLLYAEQRHALVAFGPPQSGKSAGLAVPALLEWDGPAMKAKNLPDAARFVKRTYRDGWKI